jgi:hypothetical protein
MAKKIYFSDFFRLKKSQYELDFVDIPVNNGDVPLFIDPFAIHHRVDSWSVDCHNLIVDYFQRVIKNIRDGETDNAKILLSYLHEPNQTRLGLSHGRRPRGRGIGSDQANDLFKALQRSKAVRTGLLRDLEDCALLIEGIGPDKISDITTNIIRAPLISYTQQQCHLWGISPLRKVSAGHAWLGGTQEWATQYSELPVCFEHPIILVPKAIVRLGSEFAAQDYYNREILEFLQAHHLSTNTNLVRLLKSGVRKPPHKKTLKESQPFSKHFIYEFTKAHPEVLKSFKERKAKTYGEIKDAVISERNGDADLADLAKLESRLEKIKPGRKQASDYHNLMIGLLETIFYPTLINPTKEQEINEGRGRIDICFSNASRKGFFYTLPNIKQIPSSYIFFECKNYSTDLNNPELSQMLSRFSTNRGKFGIIVCRKFEDKDTFYKRCRDVATAGQGHVIALDDEDIKALLILRRAEAFEKIDLFLDTCFKKIVM